MRYSGTARRRARALGGRRKSSVQDRLAWNRLSPALENLEDRTLLASPTITIIDTTIQNGGTAGPTVLAGSISPGSAIVGYRIDGVAGERLKFHGDSFSSTAGTWELVGPGNTVVTATTFGTDFQSDLATDGYYDLYLVGNNSNPSTAITYQVEVSNISDMPVNPAGLNTSHSGTLTASGTASFTFTASSGQHIYFDSQVSSGATYTVTDPKSQSVFSTSSSNDAGPTELKVSGTYTVKVTGASGTAYGFNVLGLPVNASALSLSTNTAGTLAAYNAAAYTFQGTPGQRLSYLYELATSFSGYAILYAPDGSRVFTNATSANNYVSPFTLTEPGAYTLIIDNETAAAANYEFKLSDAATLPLTTNATTSGTITPGRGDDLYSFSGVAGQRVYIQPVSEGHAAGAAYSLWQPDNGLSAGYTNLDPGSDDAVTLAETGTYLLWVTGNTTANANDTYSLNVYQATTPVDPLPLSTVISGSLPSPGSQHQYTFTGTVGQALYFDGLTSAAGLYYNITDPTGTTIIGNSLVTGDNGSIRLGLPGTYTVTVLGTGASAGAYSFALRDFASASALTTNATTSATLATGLTTDLYSFTGTAGQRFNLDSIGEGHVNGAYFYLYGPDKALKAQGYNDAGNTSLLVLPETGTYTLAMAGQSAANATDPYSFIAGLTTPTTPPDALTLNANTTGTIAQPGQQHVYTFAGTAGHVLFFDGQAPVLSPPLYATLTDPFGNIVGLSTSNTSTDAGPFGLTVSGTYTLVIGANSSVATTGAYSFNLHDFASSTPLTLNATTSGTLATGLSDDVYSFSGTTGQRVYIQGISDATSFGAGYTLYGPHGENITGYYTDPGYNTLTTLTQSGTYTVVVYGRIAANATDAYSLAVFDSNPTSPPDSLTLNATTSGTIALPGQQHTYTFTGSVGQALYFDGLPSAPSISAYLYDPLGTNVYIGNSVTTNDYGPFVLTKAGTYSLTVQGSDNFATGSYSFALRDFAAAVPITPTVANGATITATLATGITTDLYSFTGTAGDRVAIQGLADQHTSGAYYYLYQPGLSTYVAAYYTDPGYNTEFTLPLSGTYVLEVRGQNVANASDAYSLQVTETPVPSTALTLNATTSGTIAQPAAQHTYTFTGSVGQALYFDGLPSAPNITVYLYDPSGNNVYIGNGATTNDYGPFVLTKAGTYSLVVQASDALATGSYSFALRDFAAASPITPTASGGATITATLATGITTDLYSFTGTAGDRVAIQGLADQHANGAYYYLYQPGLSTYVAAYYTDPNYNSEITLPLSGTYVLEVRGQNVANASDAYSLQVTETTTPSTALTLNATTSGTISAPASQHTYTFTGSVGQALYFDGLPSAPSISAYLYDPSGNNVYLGNSSTTNDYGPFVLTKAGTYTLTVQGSDNLATGSYSFALRDFAAAVPITPTAANGATITATLATGITTDLYSFTGTAGDRVAIQGLADQHANGAYYYLYRPGSQSTLISGYTDLNSSNSATLPLTGTYVVGVVGQNPANASDGYSIQVIETTIPSAPLTLGTTVSGSIAQAGARNNYTFTGTIGQTIFLDGLASTSNMVLAILDPLGNAVFLNGNGTANDYGPYVLTRSGTYTVQVYAGDNVSTGTYSFAVRDFAAATSIAPSAAGGATITATLATGITTDLYTFAGTAGDSLSIQSLSDQYTSGAYYYLYRPDLGTVASNYTDAGGYRAFTLPETGNYVLAVEGQKVSNPGDAYGLKVVEIPVTTAALTLNAVVSDSLTQAGAERSYTFAGSVGQTLLFDGLSGGSGIYAELIDPIGNVTFVNQQVATDSNPFTLTKAGSYKITVYTNDATTGGYSFELLNAATKSLSLTSTPATTSGTLNPGTQAAVYSFGGTAGQSVLFKSDSFSSTGGTWRIYDPNNNNVTSATFGTNLSATLALNGTYTLVLFGAGASAITYSFDSSAVTPASVTAAGLNSPQTGTLAANGTTTYQFTAPAGTGIYFDNQASGANIAFSLANPPPGSAAIFGLSGSDQGPLVLANSGTYTLTIKNSAAASQAYAFEVYSLPTGAPALTLGALTSGTLGAQSATTYQFGGTAGQTLFLDGQSANSNVTAYLYSPSLGSINSFNLISDSSPFTLPATGAYTLLLISTQTTAQPYQFRLTDPTTIPLTTTGAATNGTLASGTAANVYSFSGTAGQRFAISSLSESVASGAYYYLFQPYNGSVTSGYVQAGYENAVTLPYSGTYTLAIEGQSAANASVTYSFKAALTTTNSPPDALTLNATTTGTIALPGAQHAYTFANTTGHVLFFDGQSPALSPALSATLYDPYGNIVGVNTSANSDQGPFALTATGTYTLLIYSNPAATGAYSFNLHDFASSTALTLGATTSGTLATGLSDDVYSFAGTAGHRLFIQGLADAHASGAYVYLYGPNGAYVDATYTDVNNSIVDALTQTGTYTLVVTGQSAANATDGYSLAVYDSAPTSPPDALTLNATTTGTIAVPGQQHTYTFAGKAGQTLFLDGQSPVQSPPIYATLTDPYGNVVGLSTSAVYTDAGPFTLTNSGTYTLVVGGYSSQATTGAYSFDLHDLASSTALTLNATTSGTLATGLSDDVYSFTGTAGHRLFIQGLADAHANGAIAYLYSPSGVNLDSVYTDINNSIVDALTQTGTYTLVVSGRNAANATDGYSVAVYDSAPTSPPDALTLNATTTGNIAVPGQQHTYTFTGKAGQILFFDGQSPVQSPPIYATLTDPYGNAVGLSNSEIDTDAGPFTLTRAGTYTLVVGGYYTQGATGAYSFDLHDFASSTPLTLNTTTSGTLLTGLSDDVYSFAGTAGHRLFIQGLADAHANGAIAYLYSPSGVNLGSVYTDVNNSSIFTLSQSGTYTLVVSGRNVANSTDAYSLAVYDSAPTSPPDALTLNATTTGTIAVPGQQHTYTFTGKAGQILFFDGQSPVQSPPIYATLTDPYGNAVGLSNSEIDGDTGPFTLTNAGTYTLVVGGYYTQVTTGAYSFDLHDFASSTPLTLNTTTSGTLATGLSDDVYSFAGVAGQRVYLQGLADTTANGAYVYLYGPRGENLASFYTDAGNNRFVSLATSGTYTLVVSGQNVANATDGYTIAAYASTPTSPPDPLTLNATTSGTISLPGQEHIYSFTGSVGQSLYFDGLPSASGLLAYLDDPLGNNVFVYTGTTGDTGPFRLTTAGTYTVVIQASNNLSTGSYSFALRDYAAATPLATNAVLSGTLATGITTDLYSFSGVAGQQVYIKSLGDGHANGAYYYLYRPDLVTYVTSGYTDAGGTTQLTLGYTGTYYLEVVGQSAANATDTYSLEVFQSTTSSTPLTLDAVTSGSIAQPAAQVSYTFTGSVGEAIFFDGQGQSSGLNAYATLTDPFGNAVSPINTEGLASDTNPFNLTVAGTYTLTISAYSGTTGTYAFNLHTIPGAKPLTVNATTGGVLSSGLADDSYTFGGTAGQQIYIQGLSDGHSNGAYYGLYGPDNQLLAQNYTESSARLGSFLPMTGTYTLVVFGQVAANPTDSYSLAVFESTIATTSLAINTSTSGVIARPGDEGIYTFAGTPGQRLAFDGQVSPGNNIVATIYDPNGHSIGTYSLGSDYLLAPLTLPGTYQVIIGASDTSTGGYQFQLLDGATVTKAQINTAEADVQVTLSAPSSVAVTVQYDTSDDSAVQPTDYLQAHGILTFAPGQTTAIIPVQIVDTAIPQFPVNKDFFVNLSNPGNATIARAQGKVTIIEGPSLTISNVTGTAPNAGTTTFSFIVSLSSPSPNAVTVQYATMDGTAKAPGDYLAATGTVTFPAGVTSETINVTVNGSNAGGADKSFTVVLSGATYSQLGAPATATGLIHFLIPTGSVAGQVYNDLNGDGLLESGEGGLAGWTLQLLNGGTVAYTATSVAGGGYSFPSVVAGTYTLRELVQGGYIETAPGSPGTYSVIVSASGVISGENFGNFQTVSVAGQVFKDLNANGTLDAGEPGLPGWTVQLYQGSTFSTSTGTDSNGNYSFSNIGPGTYTLKEVLQAGYFQTAPASPGTFTFTTSSGSNITGDSFGDAQKALASIAVTPTNPSIAKGTTQQFAATGTYNDGTTANLTGSVTWASALASVATITSGGLATGIGVGTSTITATLGSVVGSTTITVSAATLNSISVSPANPVIAKGTTQQFAATGTYSDGTTANLTGSVTWASALASVATITSGGLATGVGVGSATITATLGSVVGSTTITVSAATLNSISVSPVNPVIAKGTTQQFAATGTYSDGTTANLTGSVTWASALASVATITSGGLATGVGVGSATITATLGSVVGSTTITVSAATLNSISVSPVNPVIAKGTTQQFAATGTYSDGTTANLTGSVTWASALASVATITSGGLATGVGVGSATITATLGSVVGSTTITVSAATLNSISVSPVNPVIAKGTTQQFAATGTYSDGTTANLTGSVTWASALASVATITSGGLATGVGVGSATITATLGSVVGSTTITVSTATLNSIAVSPANPVIAKGTTQQFAATGTYSDGTTANLTGSVTWASALASVATITSGGLATGVGVGSATITATLGSVVGSTTITVSAATLNSIAVSPVNSVIAKGTTQQFAATGTYSDGTTANLTGSVTWASALASVATITSGGLATGIGVGTSTITATLGSVVGSTTITVSAATLNSIAVSPTNPVIAKGTTQQFAATGTYSDGTTANLTGSVTWASALASVATITSGGLATGVGVGTSTITATLGSVVGSTTITVSAATLNSIAVSPTNPVIAKGTTQQFAATGTYSDGTTANLTGSVTWASALASVATITSGGLATGVGVGTSTITAALGSVVGSTTITVSAATLNSIAVTPSSPVIAKGTTQQFAATGTYSDGTTANLTGSVTWASALASVATITSGGLATGVGVGSATITATLGSVVGSTTLTVSAATLNSISVSPANPVIAKGTTQQFAATGTYSDGTTANLTGSVTWASALASVATITSGGLATGVGVGTSTITATLGSVVGSTTLTVSAATLNSIAVTPSSPVIAKGTTQQFAATGTYSDGTTANLTGSVAWASALASVATITSGGLATGVGVGSSTITATLGSVVGSTTLTVSAATLNSISVSPANPVIAKGTTQQFAATGTYSDGTTADLTGSVTWASALASVATITSGGLATGVDVGSSTITATLGSVVGSTTLTVTLPVLNPVAVRDNGQAGYTQNGRWTLSSGGFNGTYEVANPAGNPVSAIWALTVPSGSYDLYATWVNASANASNAGFTVYDGSSNLGTNLKNEQLAPADGVYGGVTWAKLATVNVTNGRLSFVLTGAANGNLVADGVLAVVSGGIHQDAAPSAPSSKPTTATLTPGELIPIVAEAKALWRQAGLDPAGTAALANARFEIGDLGGMTLGLTSGDTIRIDGDGAGHGWFIDPSPIDPSAFVRSSDGRELVARAGSAAAGRMDLLTVVEHELGHILYLGEFGVDDVMTQDLGAGIRRLPTASDVAATPYHPATLGTSSDVSVASPAVIVPMVSPLAHSSASSLSASSVPISIARKAARPSQAIFSGVVTRAGEARKSLAGTDVVSANHVDQAIAESANDPYDFIEPLALEQSEIRRRGV